MKPDPRESHGLAIVGPYGNIWTDEIFDTPEEAVAYLKNFWRDGFDAPKWKLASATKTISLDVETHPLPFIEVKDHM